MRELECAGAIENLKQGDRGGNLLPEACSSTAKLAGRCRREVELLGTGLIAGAMEKAAEHPLETALQAGSAVVLGAGLGALTTVELPVIAGGAAIAGCAIATKWFFDEVNPFNFKNEQRNYYISRAMQSVWNTDDSRTLLRAKAIARRELGSLGLELGTMLLTGPAFRAGSKARFPALKALELYADKFAPGLKLCQQGAADGTAAGAVGLDANIAGATGTGARQTMPEFFWLSKGLEGFSSSFSSKEAEELPDYAAELAIWLRGAGFPPHIIRLAGLMCEGRYERGWESRIYALVPPELSNHKLHIPHLAKSKTGESLHLGRTFSAGGHTFSWNNMDCITSYALNKPAVNPATGEVISEFPYGAVLKITNPLLDHGTWQSEWGRRSFDARIHGPVMRVATARGPRYVYVQERVEQPVAQDEYKDICSQIWTAGYDFDDPGLHQIGRSLKTRKPCLIDYSCARRSGSVFVPEPCHPTQPRS